jgi:hypothetical protein
MVMAALAVVEADAVVSASCACNNPGAQASGTSEVDFNSQLLAARPFLDLDRFAVFVCMKKSPWVSSFIHLTAREWSGQSPVLLVSAENGDDCCNKPAKRVMRSREACRTDA